jgi:hypothetical protein
MSSGRGARILFVGAAVAVTATVAAAMVVLGSPSQHRKQRLDGVRIENLRMLEQWINGFVYQHKQLPGSLAELAKEPGFPPPLHDPESGASYGYERLTAETYRLCATFDLAPPAGYSVVISVSFREHNDVRQEPETWAYRPGRQCFDRRAVIESSDKRP